MGSYVSHIKIVEGGSDVEAQGKCPAGYTLVPVDLNEGAKGRWIYLCFAKKNDLDPVVAMALSFSGNPSHAGHGCNRGGDVDLNKGSGGNYIHLYYSTYSDIEDARKKNAAPLTAPWNQWYLTGNPITDITAKSGQIPPDTPSGYMRVEGYDTSNLDHLTTVNPDVNRGAGGKYIYLYYKRSAKALVKQH